MIQAQDLRIGNWASNGQIEFQITSKDIYHLDVYVNRVIAKPIPITPEWLERMGFGFEKIGNGWHLDVEINHYCLYSESGKYVDLFVFSDEVGQQCQYIHQLQNLYFALTGEEITIKDGD
jgi:hypothetical protein